MIDLHVHTNYSDGTWDLKKLLEEAEKAKIEVLSITDHDTVKVYKELEKIDYKKVYSGKILSGVEFNTVYDGVAFHLLAYDFDYRNHGYMKIMKLKSLICKKNLNIWYKAVRRTI